VSGKRWSDAETQALYDLLKVPLTHKKISQSIGRSMGAIARKMEREGWVFHRKDRWDPEDVVFMQTHYEEKGYRWMADMLGRSPFGIEYMARKLKLKRRLPMAEVGS
jgi:hypothetical protein